MKKLITVVCLFLCLSTMVSAQKKVLIIESYHSDYPWDRSCIEGIRETIGGEVDIETFQMDTKRIPKDQYQTMADKALSYFNQSKPDLVILGDDNAFKFLGQKINDTGTPSVFLGMNSHPRTAGVNEMDNVTGILERPLFKRNIYELNNLLDGKMKSVLVLFDSGNTSKAAVEGEFKGKTEMSFSGINVKLELIGEQDKWHETVKSAAGKYDAIIVGLYHTLVDAEGTHISANDVLKWTLKNTPIPLFAFWDFAVGKGKTAGGLVLFGKIQGQEAAKYAKRILNGEKPINIKPVIAKKGRFYFSKSELDRWNLALPDKIKHKSVLID